MRRFCVNALPTEHETLSLGQKESHHLVRVLRCRAGDTIQLFDGKGAFVDCIIISAQDGQAILKPLHAPMQTCPKLQSILCLAQTKPKALDIGIRMATESGVTQIIVFVAERSISRTDRSDRWLRIATASAKQCGRSSLPEIHWCAKITDIPALIPSSITEKWIALPGAQRQSSTPKASTIVVGPEGGFTESEAHWAIESGFKPIGLGYWTLRADTAAVIAAAHIAAGSWS